MFPLLLLYFCNLVLAKKKSTGNLLTKKDQNKVNIEKAKKFLIVDATSKAVPQTIKMKENIIRDMEIEQLRAHKASEAILKRKELENERKHQERIREQQLQQQIQSKSKGQIYYDY